MKQFNRGPIAIALLHHTGILLMSKLGGGSERDAFVVGIRTHVLLSNK